MKLNFQFAKDASAQARADVVAGLRKAGAGDVHPLFPGEADPELAGLHVAEVEPAKSQTVLKWLRARKEVAFAEEPVRRKLVR